MAETSNRFDLRETLGELKDFVRARAGAAAGQTQHKPSASQLETAVLSAVAAEPKNAAQVVAAIALASAGGTSLSAAQVHPVLAKLTEAGLLKAKSKDDRKVFAITDAGREALVAAGEKLGEELGEEPVAGEGADSQPRWGSAKDWLQFDPNFMKSAAKLAPTISDVAKTGTRAQQEQATKVLEEARRQLHVILAEG
jgi:DNA-binding PadR family transcriptional regulator